ncbi:MAG: hypothetical protein J6J66_00525 [Clostridia bacterium]|nr:hypothetical protein [Clostridia bacterium]
MAYFAHTEEVERVLGYRFKDRSLLIQAFTRTSFCNEHHARGDGEDYQSNEVLEFFGDAVLSCAIVSQLIQLSSERYAHGIRTSLSEGDFSNIKSHLSDKSNLSRALRETGLQRYLLMGEGDKKLGMENEPSVMEDLFESLIGAIYIDCDMQINVVIDVVKRLLDTEKYLEKGRPSQSPKNLLQEYCADKENRLGAPVYRLISEVGPQHKKEYLFACEIDGEEWGRGVGKNHRAAQTAAALEALANLEKREGAGKESEKRHPADTAMSRLYEYAAVRGAAPPVYTDREAEGSTVQAPLFVSTCRLMGRSTCGEGKSKRDARQTAAERMLLVLNHGG